MPQSAPGTDPQHERHREQGPVPGHRHAIELWAVHRFAGRDAPHEPLPADVADNRVDEGDHGEQKVVDKKHDCFQLYEYLYYCE